VTARREPEQALTPFEMGVKAAERLPPMTPEAVRRIAALLRPALEELAAREGTEGSEAAGGHQPG
jgi:hypothetical protein